MISYYAYWVICLWFNYCLMLAIYRLYLHPLATFPGPRLAAATGWYETYADLFQRSRGSFMGSIARMHRTYGPIVRVNPQEIHVCDSNWLDTLYAGPARGKRDKYSPAALMTDTPGGIVGTVPHELHKLRRGAVTPLLSKPNVAAACPMVYEHTKQLLDRIEAQIRRDGYAEMTTDCLAFATDTVARHSTGRSRGLLDNEALAAQWKKSTATLATWTSIARHFSWAIPLVLMMPEPILKRALPDVLPMVRLHRDALQDMNSLSKSQDPTTDTDLPTVFSTVLSSDNLPPPEKAADRIAQECIVLIMAGSETTARTLTTAIYFILKNGSIQMKLEEELKGVMPDPSSQPTLKQLQSLPWLSAIIKESLRLMSLLTIRFPLVSPNEPLRYKHWVIPAGTPVSMTLREVLQDGEIFEDPHEYRPERWLDPMRDLPKADRYFVPFGRGSRMCIGMSLAYAELYIVLACLFRRYHIRLHDTIRNRELDTMRGGFNGDEPHNILGLRVTFE